MEIYTVKRGDSIYNIARRFGVSAELLISDNQLENPNRLSVGQSLVVPVDSTRHTVALGESLYSIAKKYSITIDAILKRNRGILDRNKIYPGDILMIPVWQPPYYQAIAVGYAYPFITDAALDMWLPHLSYADIFSYGVGSDGTLLPIDDGRVINRSLDAGVSALMVVSNIGESGNFETGLASNILNNRAAEQALFNNIDDVLSKKAYAGVDVDFENIAPGDRDYYGAFLRRLAERLHTMKCILSVAIPAKSSDNPSNTYTAGYDYAEIGAAVDLALLMTYDYHFKTGAPGAVSPLDMVEKTVAYASSVMDPKKILLGIPNYGYDWPVPFDPSKPGKTITNRAAAELASGGYAQISFDEAAAAPHFYYNDGEGRRVVWFEDAKSLARKLALIEKYGLAGYGIWNINNLWSAGIIVPASMFGDQF